MEFARMLTLQHSRRPPVRHPLARQRHRPCGADDRWRHRGYLSAHVGAAAHARSRAGSPDRWRMNKEQSAKAALEFDLRRAPILAGVTADPGGTSGLIMSVRIWQP